jgi:hypothetical protein
MIKVKINVNGTFKASVLKCRSFIGSISLIILTIFITIGCPFLTKQYEGLIFG